MSELKATSVVSGALFGAALMSAGVYSPHIIIGQMKLVDFHMLKAFIAASASSAIAIHVARRLNIAKCSPRLPTSLGWVGIYDGNVIGGALLGTGMALTGACPGTLLPQLAVGVPSGGYVLAGGMFGGVLYSRLRTSLDGPYSGMLKEKAKNSVASTQPTLYQRMGASEEVGVLGYAAMCLGFVAGLSLLFPEEGKVFLPAAIGGFFIGVSQAMSLVLTGNALGVSTAYEQLGDLFWWYNSARKTAPPKYSALAFPLGSIMGAFALSKFVVLPPVVSVDVGPVRALVGGVLLVLGGRIAGGCTSGHGISGMSMLSIASIVSVVSMFGTGILVTKMIG